MGPPRSLDATRHATATSAAACDDGGSLTPAASSTSRSRRRRAAGSPRARPPVSDVSADVLTLLREVHAAVLGLARHYDAAAHGGDGVVPSVQWCKPTTPPRCTKDDGPVLATTPSVASTKSTRLPRLVAPTQSDSSDETSLPDTAALKQCDALDETNLTRTTQGCGHMAPSHRTKPCVENCDPMSKARQTWQRCRHALTRAVCHS